MTDREYTGLRLRAFRMRRYINDELQRLLELQENLAAAGQLNPWSQGYFEGQRHALMKLKIGYLLTAEESATQEATRREMFG